MLGVFENSIFSTFLFYIQVFFDVFVIFRSCSFLICWWAEQMPVKTEHLTHSSLQLFLFVEHTTRREHTGSQRARGAWPAKMTPNQLWSAPPFPTLGRMSIRCMWVWPYHISWGKIWFLDFFLFLTYFVTSLWASPWTETFFKESGMWNWETDFLVWIFGAVKVKEASFQADISLV